MKHEPFLSRTGQLWKIAALGVWCAAGFGYLISNMVRRSNGSTVDVLDEAAAVTISLLVAVYLVLSLVCPKCRGRLLVYAIKTFDINDVKDALVKMTACPMCGYLPLPRRGGKLGEGS